MTALDDLMRRLLFLPEARSTFAVPVDRLHFFVITVTMIASTITGLMAFMRLGALLVFFALAGLMAVLWRKELAMRRRAVPGPPRTNGSAA